MANYQNLNRRRGYQKSLLTKLEAYIKDVELKDVDMVMIHSKLEKLQSIKVAIDELRLQFSEAVTDKELEQCEEEFFMIEERIDELEITIRRLAETKLKMEKDNNKDQGMTDVKCVKAKVKLPEIPLPSFAGKYDEWNNFIEQFNALISENEELNDTQKLYYLKAALCGEARQIITTEDDFKALLQSLRERYDNKRLIADTHVNTILNIKRMSNEAHAELQQLVDKVMQQLRALKQMKLQMNELSEVILINVLVNKIDGETRKQLEMSLQSKDLLSWECFMAFLQKRCQALEGLERSVVKNRAIRIEKPPRIFMAQTSTESKMKSMNRTCLCCDSKVHNIYGCEKFKRIEVSKKYDILRQNRLCFNCLKANHTTKYCNSKGCNYCDKKHHTLLHTNEVSTGHIRVTDNQLSSAEKSMQGTTSLTVMNNQTYFKGPKRVLLSTAIIYLKDSQEILRPCRVLLDSASQSNFITEECATALGLKKSRINMPVSGLNGSLVKIKNIVHTVMASPNDQYERNISLLVVPKVTGILPVEPVDVSNWNIPTSIRLADPLFNRPGKIDSIIGAEFFLDMLKSGKLRLKNNTIILQESVLGWIISGNIIENEQDYQENYCHLSSNLESLDKNLRRFWELESVPEENVLPSEEQIICEEHFKKTYSRGIDGRFVVQLPLNVNIQLGCTRNIAEARLQSLWCKLKRDDKMREMYCEFISEYERLGHMEKISEADDEVFAKCYLPHHGIYKEASRTTKLRVVFDASAISSTGKSLNNLLLNGGVIQDDLFSIIMRFRVHKFVITADIEKMYRQILVDERQCDLQRILWKKSADSKVEEYRLLTLTYGTKSAPYIATRVIKQLALDEQEDLPLAAKVLTSDVYMDDIITGTDTKGEAFELRTQLIEICKRGKMRLHKWCANESDLIPEAEVNNVFQFEGEEAQPVKTLGLMCSPSKDCFKFERDFVMSDRTQYTKRKILSEIARLFDPLGLIGPIITYAKIFMKKLWLLNLGWDQDIPQEEHKKWLIFIRLLQDIDCYEIDRYVGCDKASKIEIHGYSDASENAYGGCVYLRCIKPNQEIVMSLLCSKSRVAPVKKVTIPRLELCGALLLARLVKRVVESLKMEIDSVHLWCDSSIVLSWIKTESHLLKSFVANRVISIQEMTSLYTWHHISSEENPADILSRGATPDKLISMKLWWLGPSMLSVNVDSHQFGSKLIDTKDKTYMRELRSLKDTSLVMVEERSVIEEIIQRSSNYLKVLRIVAYMLRFYWNCNNKDNKRTGYIRCEELRDSQRKIIKIVQRNEFDQEWSRLKNGHPISKGSKLVSLNPFLDHQEMLRVGGRLSNSLLKYNQKHPLILAAKHKFTRLIFEYVHKINLHVGAQTLLSFVRQEFWPIGGKNVANKVVRNCVKCFRAKPVSNDQLMGDLPLERVRPSFAFNTIGVDFCGPFFVKYAGQRKGSSQKIYIAILICFSTKTVHLELVTNLTSEAFIACLKRFFSRRGKSAKIDGDNATNFVGANNELKRLHELVRRPDAKLSYYMSAEGVNWSFIPPESPNYGGLWESGVKSIKYHLRRTAGKATYTYEEFSSLVVQIKGILNSRPLLAMSTNYENAEALTPGHFLIGRAINTLEEPEIGNIPDNRLSRWQRVTKVIQVIWNKWKREYLNNLQQRYKWQLSRPNVKIGDVVVIKDATPPLKWPLGIIQRVITGADGKVRVMEIRTAKRIMKRAVSRICVLPINEY